MLQVELGRGDWVRLQVGGWHGCLHGEGGCGLLCQARLDWWGWSLGVGLEDISEQSKQRKVADGGRGSGAQRQMQEADRGRVNQPKVH